MPSTNESLFYQIALTFLPEVGDVRAKNLISYCGSVEAIFKMPKAKLEKIPGIGSATAANIFHSTKDSELLKRAEEEIKFIDKHKIIPLFFLDEKYPKRLLNCTDSPILLYYKGNADLNHQRMISIVGTRKATEYGKMLTEQLIEDLSSAKVMILSGLAYGIDICAHRASLKNNIPTVAVLGHGLDRLYPAQHSSTAKEMIVNGGLLTDYPSKTNPDKENFPNRNRIVAGMSDACIVIESAVKGGALITAEIANSYNRDVFAFPGSVKETYSQGCNYFIKTNRAGLIENANDLLEAMCWSQSEKQKKKVQKELFIELDKEEKEIFSLFKNGDSLHMDQINFAAGLNNSKVAATLLELEFKGLIKALPGKQFILT